MKLTLSAILCFIFINCSFSQEQDEIYNLVNDYLSLKSNPVLKTFLYYKAGENGIFDEMDSLSIDKNGLKSQFKFLENSAYRIKLIDSLFAQFDKDYMRYQNKRHHVYEWRIGLLNNNIYLYQKEKELKGGFIAVGLSVPVFINKEYNWAFLHDFRVSFDKIVLMKKENKKWTIVEEYTHQDIE
jgi:hypothetical protein